MCSINSIEMNNTTKMDKKRLILTMKYEQQELFIKNNSIIYFCVRFAKTGGCSSGC